MDRTQPTNALFQRDPSYPYPVLVRGDGIYLYDNTGKRYIDGVSGAGNVTLGHGRQRIIEAMADQARSLAYCFSSNFANQPALDLADRIAHLAPGSLNHVYFVSGGSEAIETALKMILLHHLQRGQGQKQMVISRWRSYHGATIGALSATGTAMRTPFSPWLASFSHIAPCYPCNCRFSGCEGKCNLTCARELEQAILQVGPENVAAFVAEPVVLGEIAAAVPPLEYFSIVREICNRYDVLFVADEIITGFGRTGKYFGIEHWGVVPDIIVFGKGISAGYAPLAGVIFQDRIRESLDSIGKPFPHVFTYVNNPVAMRVGLTVLDIIEEEQILDHVTQMGKYLLKRAQDLRRWSCVSDIRGKGLILGIDFLRHRDRNDPALSTVPRRLNEILMEQGLSLSVTAGSAGSKSGNDLRFYPPLTITQAQIDEALEILGQGLEKLETEIS